MPLHRQFFVAFRTPVKSAVSNSDTAVNAICSFLMLNHLLERVQQPICSFDAGGRPSELRCADYKAGRGRHRINEQRPRAAALGVPTSTI